MAPGNGGGESNSGSPISWYDSQSLVPGFSKFRAEFFKLFPFLVPQGAPTFTRKPQILQKTSDSGDPAIVFDIGFQVNHF